MDELKLPVVIDGKQLHHTLDHFPDECPVCHRACLPTKWGDLNFIYHKKTTFLQIVFKCPCRTCSQLFIAMYATAESITKKEVSTFYLGGYIPCSPKPTQFDEGIRTVSPLFVDIYNQAEDAERRKLTHICGPGYRKALEFLIKDYLVKGKELDKDTIERTFLAKCIRDHLPATNIAKCAERAAWLGNDEMHYVRRWTDNDVSDLKTLILLTVRWIETEMLTDKYASTLRPPGKEEALNHGS